jgi:FlaA1/EpsC-like NDP-sugar epimerase
MEMPSLSDKTDPRPRRAPAVGEPRDMIEAGHSPTSGSDPGRACRRRGGDWIGRRIALRSRVALVLLVNALGFLLIYLSAFVIRFDGSVPARFWGMAIASLPLVLSMKLLAVVATGSHRGWWRYATFADLVKIAEAATLGSVTLALIALSLGAVFSIPLSILVMDWAGVLLVFCANRAATRLFLEYGRTWIPDWIRPRQRVLVVGAGEAGEALVRKLHVSSRLGMRVVGFLDHDRRTLGRTLAGLPVLGTPDDVKRLAQRHKIATVLVPAGALPTRTIRGLIVECSTIGVKVQVVPGFDALISGGLTVQPRDVDLHDLLCRPPVELDTQSLRSFLEGRAVLVTGASGSIGSVICRQVMAYHPRRIIVVDHNENGVFYLERELGAIAGNCEVIPFVASVSDSFRLRSAFMRYRPDVVLHAAAHKHVPMMEANPGEAVKNNVFATRTLVEEALRWNVDALVMISTDKAVNPTSVMGSSKRLAEMVVQSLSGLTTTRLVTVRFGNVLGSTGSVPIFKEQIRAGGPITVTHPDMTRFFMTIPEAAQLVLQAGAFGTSGDIFVLDMGEPVKVVDLARDLIRLSGLEEGREIDIVFTGLRPGEKLFEELYNDAETRLPTPHPKIFRARHRETSSQQLWESLNGLAAVVDGSPDEVIAALQAAIPEYQPNRPKLPRPVANADLSVTPLPSPPAPAVPRGMVRPRAVKGNTPHVSYTHSPSWDVTRS